MPNIYISPEAQETADRIKVMVLCGESVFAIKPEVQKLVALLGGHILIEDTPLPVVCLYLLSLLISCKES